MATSGVVRPGRCRSALAGRARFRVDPGGPYCHVTQLIDNRIAQPPRVNLRLADLLVSESQVERCRSRSALSPSICSSRPCPRSSRRRSSGQPADRQRPVPQRVSGRTSCPSCAMGQALKAGDVLVDELVDDARLAHSSLRPRMTVSSIRSEPNPGDVAAGSALGSGCSGSPCDHRGFRSRDILSHSDRNAGGPTGSAGPVPVLAVLPCPPLASFRACACRQRSASTIGQFRNLIGSATHSAD